MITAENYDKILAQYVQLSSERDSNKYYYSQMQGMLKAFWEYHKASGIMPLNQQEIEELYRGLDTCRKIITKLSDDVPVAPLCEPVATVISKLQFTVYSAMELLNELKKTAKDGAK